MKRIQGNPLLIGCDLFFVCTAASDKLCVNHLMAERLLALVCVVYDKRTGSKRFQLSNGIEGIHRMLCRFNVYKIP